MNNNPIKYQQGYPESSVEAGNDHLNPQDVQVADEVPGRFTVFIHPRETVTCRVVDCIS